MSTTKEKPMYLEKTSGGIDRYTTESFLYSSRVIIIDKEINESTGMEYMNQIMLLTLKDAKKPIVIIVNSPGGEILMGMVLLDCIRATSCPIITIAMGMAASMGAMILAAGTKGMRYCTPNSKVLIHEPLVRNISGSCSDINAASESMKDTKKRMDHLLKEFTGNTIKQVEKATSYDHWMTAEEALDFHIVDHITSQDNLFEIIKGNCKEDNK